MEIGDTILPAGWHKNAHLQVVISNPADDPDKVVLVGITSYDTPEHKARKEGSCVLWPGDHPWISHESSVSYRDGKVLPKSQLDHLIAKGKIAKRERMSRPVLDRILEGAEKTEELPNKCRVVLLRQGLIES